MDLLTGLEEAIGVQQSQADIARLRHAEQVAKMAARIRVEDSRGHYWPVGLLSELEGRILIDSRYAFLKGLPRSALFGELLAGEYEALRFGERSEATLECGRLLNLFVSTFDGACDDVTEALPATLAGITPILSAFPEPVAVTSHQARDLSGLVTGVGLALSNRLGVAILRAPTQSRLLMAEIVHTAYASQIHELSAGIQDPASAAKGIEAKSIGPFAVAFIISHAMRGSMKGFDAIAPVSRAVGRVFGWIDDLADWREDAASGRTTALSLFLGTTDINAETILAADSFLRAETYARIAEMQAVLSQYGLDSLGTALAGVILDWVGQI
jgi:hypothetical protein